MLSAPTIPGGPGSVLAELSEAVYGRLHPVAVGDAGQPDGWVGVDAVNDDPGLLWPLVEASAVRFGSDERGLVLAQVARESISALVTAGVDLWARERRLLDLRAANVVLREGELAVVVAVRQVGLAVLADDPLAVLPDQCDAASVNPNGWDTAMPVHRTSGRPRSPVIEVVDEAEMFRRLVDQTIGHPVPSGAVPGGRADEVAAVAAIVAAVRRLVRCGARHLWGTAALAASTALTRVSHIAGKQADQDRTRLYQARPDLGRTVDLVSVDAGVGGPDDTLTFAVRRTCCLLYKLPGGRQCATCSLQDRDAQVTELTAWYRSQRAQATSGPRQ